MKNYKNLAKKVYEAHIPIIIWIHHNCNDEDLIKIRENLTSSYDEENDDDYFSIICDNIEDYVLSLGDWYGVFSHIVFGE